MRLKGDVMVVVMEVMIMVVAMIDERSIRLWAG